DIRWHRDHSRIGTFRLRRRLFEFRRPPSRQHDGISIAMQCETDRAANPAARSRHKRNFSQRHQFVNPSGVRKSNSFWPETKAADVFPTKSAWEGNRTPTNLAVLRILSP